VSELLFAQWWHRVDALAATLRWLTDRGDVKDLDGAIAFLSKPWDWTHAFEAMKAHAHRPARVSQADRESPPRSTTIAKAPVRATSPVSKDTLTATAIRGH